MEKLVTSTSTISTSKYPRIIQEFVDFVYNAKSEKDAVHNIKVLLESYKKRLTVWELIKLLFNK